MNNQEYFNQYNNRITSKDIYPESSEKFNPLDFDLGVFDVNKEAARQANELIKDVYIDLFDEVADLANQTQILFVKLELIKKKLRKLLK